MMVVKADPTHPRVFRLLALEQMFDSHRMRSAQVLISQLLQFPNWNNSTDQYVSYIHLVTLYNYSEVFDEVKPSWVGTLGDVNLSDEVSSFLGKASPGEIVILYYCGHDNAEPDPNLPGRIQPGFLGITPSRLKDWLNRTILQASLTLVLDTCSSGLWTSFMSKCSILAACKTDQLAYGGDIGIFTDGIINAFYQVNDSNNDGWLSAEEVFQFAKNFTEEIVWWGGGQNPQSYYSVLDGDLPLFQRDPTKPFPTWDLCIVSVLVNCTRIEPGFPVTINVTVRNQGEKPTNFDVNVYVNSSLLATEQSTLLPGETINMTFLWTTGEKPSLYIIDSTVSICPGELDISDNSYFGLTLKVTFRTDINYDWTVGIDDIFIASVAFGSDPADARWNPNADVNGDNYVGIDDILMIAKDFGKG
jgi:hypothetical protein